MRIVGPHTPGYYQGWIKPASLDGYVLEPMRETEAMIRAREVRVKAMVAAAKAHPEFMAALEKLADMPLPRHLDPTVPPDPTNLLDKRNWPQLTYWDRNEETS